MLLAMLKRYNTHPQMSYRPIDQLPDRITCWYAAFGSAVSCMQTCYRLAGL